MPRRLYLAGDSIDIGALRSKDLTFAEFAVKWFEDYVRPNNKYSEQLSKKYILSSSLLPFFGRKPVGQIKGHDIERYKAQQVQEGYTNKTITNRLKQVLAHRI
ncbi:hypothetical protein [Bradyrhizobium arachidis]|uniref:hypothetical protein n=1 Tax=Bradyrhizobium arachidis TaxID=858423 RepID=UPI0038D14AAE